MKQYLITAVVAIFALMVAFPSLSGAPGPHADGAPSSHYHAERL
jgi:hypothetical protein